MSLTKTQAKILSFLKAYTKAQGYPPTRQEICEHMGYKSVNSAQEALRAMAKKGAIKVSPETTRGIKVL